MLASTQKKKKSYSQKQHFRNMWIPADTLYTELFSLYGRNGKSIIILKWQK